MKIVTERDREEFVKKVKAIKLNKPYIGEIKAYRRTRTLPQNRLYRLWLNVIKTETGNDPDYMDCYFKDKYLGYEEKEVFGKKIRRLVSTKALSTKEFSTFLDEVQQEMAGEGVELLWPDEQRFSDFVEHYSGRYF